MVSDIKEKFLASNFIARSASGLLLAPIVLFVTYKGGFAFSATLLFVSMLMSVEWMKMVNVTINRLYRNLWYMTGAFYIAIPMISLLYLRSFEDNGFVITCWLMLSVWGSDIGGYFFGVALGGPKLIPKISPKKTWAGLLGCIVGSFIVGVIFSVFSTFITYEWLYINILLALISQVGDITESAIKRHFQIKDSSTLIPGHGGILDRMDGFVTAAPFAVLYLHFML
jgi:phosphatidate cytidylyltransferase